MEHRNYTAEEEQYIVRNPKEVMQIITDLMKSKTTLKVSFNQGEDIYLTTVIAVDAKSHAVHLDIGRDDDFNRRLLASQHVIFSKDEGIEIKWTSRQISEVALQDGKAIRISLPQDLVRLQRREYFRFATPIINPVLCEIPLSKETDSDTDDVLNMTLADVSLGGIAAVMTGLLNPALVIGARFNNCKIGFPDVGGTNLTLQIIYIIQMHTKDGITRHRIGLQYIEPSRGNEGLINRYVYLLERQAIALANGLS